MNPPATECLCSQPNCAGDFSRMAGRAAATHVPMVKFFNSVGIGAWLATELYADGDILFGLAQLNDAPELGSFSLEELATLELPFGMHIERGLFFTGIFPISAYAEAARETGSITAAIHILMDRMLEALRKARSGRHCRTG